MEYKEFKNELKGIISDLVGEETKVMLHQVRKNNSVVRDAVVIQKKGQNVNPTIYLEQFYDEYLKGMDICCIAKKILLINDEYSVNENFVVDDFFEFENIKSKIVFKLVNTEKNLALLEDVPHRDFYDLTLIYCCIIDDVFGDFASTVVHNCHMNNWGIDESILFEIGYENTLDRLGCTFKSMNELMLDMLASGKLDKETMEGILEQLSDDEQKCPMYILTNNNKLFGAGLMVYSHILEDIARKIGSFYIIPSSIHEIIMVPDGCSMDEQSMLDMVSEVNSTQLSYDEVLSDNIYHYDAGKNELNIVNKIKLGAFLYN